MTQSSAGTILPRCGHSPNLDRRKAGSQAGCCSVHLYRSTQERSGNCWGLGTRLRTPWLGTATRRHTPGGALLVGPGELLVVVALLGRAPRHDNHKPIIEAGLEFGTARLLRADVGHRLALSSELLLNLILFKDVLESFLYFC